MKGKHDHSPAPPTGDDIYELLRIFEDYAMQAGPFYDPVRREFAENQYQRLRFWLRQQIKTRGTGWPFYETPLPIEDEKRRRRWAGEEDA